MGNNLLLPRKWILAQKIWQFFEATLQLKKEAEFMAIFCPERSYIGQFLGNKCLTFLPG